MQAIIFAGGMGKRLGTNIPKALLKIKDKTLLQYSVEMLTEKKMLIKHFNFLLGYKAKEVEREIKRLSKEIDFTYSISLDPKIGCGRTLAFKHAFDSGILKEATAVVHHVDDFITYSFSDIARQHIFRKNKNTILSLVVSDSIRLPYGIVKRAGTRYDFFEKPVLHSWAYVGLCILEPPAYKYLLGSEKENPEDEAFPLLCRDGKANIIKIPLSSWIPVNTRKEAEEIKRII